MTNAEILEYALASVFLRFVIVTVAVIAVLYTPAALMRAFRWLRDGKPRKGTVSGPTNAAGLRLDRCYECQHVQYHAPMCRRWGTPVADTWPKPRTAVVTKHPATLTHALSDDAPRGSIRRALIEIQGAVAENGRTMTRLSVDELLALQRGARIPTVAEDDALRLGYGAMPLGCPDHERASRLAAIEVQR